MSVFDAYETVIGLECHVQLATASKLFSPAPSRYGDAPNTNVDVVDAGLPGVLPVLNRRAVDFAIRLGLALGCEIRPHSVFSRKHYFYPDLPKGYQISQFDLPICEGGSIEIETEAGTQTIGITRIHIEEDAGKNLHVEGGKASFCDYNRAGTPLLEVVSEPDIRSSEVAMAYFKALRQMVMYLEICDGSLQEGSMRADANVSVRKKGASEFGTRTETKNLNSIRFLGQAIDFEARRQVLDVEAGKTIIQETRLWDSDKKESRSMRTKEEAHDYRYFPEPDLLPLDLGDDEVNKVREQMPELPAQKRARFVSDLGLSEYDASVLSAEKKVAAWFEQALEGSAPKSAKAIANWVINDVLRTVKEMKDPTADDDLDALDKLPFGPAAIGELVRLIEDKVISGKIAKDVFAELAAGNGTSPAKIVDDKGWKVERDEGALNKVIDDVIANNQKQLEQYLAGKEALLGYFVGQVMKATKGQADPQQTNEMLRARLAQEAEKN